MDKYVIIVAGGTGSRIPDGPPKQFLPLNGKPVLMHSIEQFYAFDPAISIIVSLHPDFRKAWEELCHTCSFNRNHRVVDGGETRYHSVKNGLQLVPSGSLVAIHDAARPLVTVGLIEQAFAMAKRSGSAIPSIPANETIRMVEPSGVKLLDRTTLRIIQTPQVFLSDIIKQAYLQEYSPGFTDDGSLLEAMGLQVNLVNGDPFNMKITLPGDLEIAEILLRNRNEMAVRNSLTD